MKHIVIYDSVYGTTKEIAETVAEALGKETKLLKASDAQAADIESADLIIVGSPTYGGRPTESMQAFLKKLNGVSLQGKKIACFDTRLQAKWVKVFGFAAGKMEKRLKNLGGMPVSAPQGFYVKGTKGPLVETEYKHAREWVRNILAFLEK